MKNKTVDILLFAIVLIIFLSYFGIRHIIIRKNDFYKQLEITRQYVTEEKWNEAKSSYQDLKMKWENIRFIYMINYAEADVTTMEEYMNNLMGGIETKNLTSSLTSSLQIRDLWKNMLKVVPQP